MTAPQINSRRSLRRLAKKKSLPLPLPSSNERSDGKSLHERLNLMETQLTKLGDVFDQQTDVFGDGLKYLESMTLIFQRVMNDMMTGTVRCIGDIPPETAKGLPTRVGSPTVIDFRSYVQEYWLCMAFADFATDCRRIWDENHPEQKSGPGPILAPPRPDEDEVITFGGT